MTARATAAKPRGADLDALLASRLRRTLSDGVLDDRTATVVFDDVGRMPVGMLIPTGGLIAVGLVLTVFAGPIFAFRERASAEVLDRGQYVSAVLKP